MQGSVTTISYEGELVQSLGVEFPRSNPPLSLQITMLERIGQGSFGTVYRATSENPRFHNFALKVAVGKSQRLHQEVDVMNKVCTKGRLHVVRMEFVAFNESETMIAVGMELCVPLTMHDFLVSYRLTSELEMMYLGYQVLKAVSGVHDEDCVHRDVKLQNFVFDLDCNVKLIDFGLAFNSITPPPGDLVAGTVSFMAPEMASNALTKSNRVSVGAPADVWSAGMVLFSIATQRNPYPQQPALAPGADEASLQPPTQQSSSTTAPKSEYNQPLLRRVAKGQWEWPQGVSSVSADLRHLIESMLVVSPSARPTLRQVLNHPIWSGRRRSPPKALETFLGLEQFDSLLAPTPEQEQHLLRNVERKSQIVNVSRAASVASSHRGAEGEDGLAGQDEGQCAASGTNGSVGGDAREVQNSELDISATQRIDVHTSRQGRQLEKEFEVVLDESFRKKKPTRSKSRSVLPVQPASSTSTAREEDAAVIGTGRSLQRPDDAVRRSRSRSLLPSKKDDAHGDPFDLPLPPQDSKQMPGPRSRSASASYRGPMPVAIATTPPPSPPKSPVVVRSAPPSRAGSASRSERPPTGAIATSSVSQRRERSRSRSLVKDVLPAPCAEDANTAEPALRSSRPTKRVPVVQIHTPSSLKQTIEDAAASEVVEQRSSQVRASAKRARSNSQELVMQSTKTVSEGRSSSQKRLHGTLSSELATEERKQRAALSRLLYHQLEFFIAHLWVKIEEDQCRYSLAWLHEAQLPQVDHPHRFRLKTDDKGSGYDEGFVCDVCNKEFAPKSRGKTQWNYHHCTCNMDVCAACFRAYEAKCTCKACRKVFDNIKGLREHKCAKEKLVAAASPPAKRQREKKEVVASPPRANKVPPVTTRISGKKAEKEEPPRSKGRRVEPPSSQSLASTTKAASPAREKKSSEQKPAAASPSKAALVAAARVGRFNPPKRVDNPVAVEPGKWKPNLAAKVTSKPPPVPPPTSEERTMLLNGDHWIRYFHFAATPPKQQPPTSSKMQKRRGEEAGGVESAEEPRAFVYQIQPGRTGVILLGMDAPAHSVVYSLTQGCMMVVGAIDPSAAGSDSVMVMPSTTVVPIYSDLANMADALQREDERMLKQRRAPGTMSVYQPPTSATRAKDAVFQYVRWFRVNEAAGIAVFLLSTGGVQVFIGSDAELRWKDPSRRFLVRSNGVCEAVDHSTFPLMLAVDRVMASTIDDLV